MTTVKKGDRILRLPEVEEKVGMKKVTIYRLMKNGQFPKNSLIGARAVGWLESQIDEFLAEKFCGI